MKKAGLKWNRIVRYITVRKKNQIERVEEGADDLAVIEAEEEIFEEEEVVECFLETI